MEQNDSDERKKIIAAKKRLSLARFRNRIASDWETSFLLQTGDLVKFMKNKSGEVIEVPN